MVSSHSIRQIFPSLGGWRILLALALLALLASPEPPARADIIFSNFGPHGNYDPTSGWTVGAIDSTTVEDIAVLFRVGSRAATLDEVDVAMGLMNKPNLVNLEIVPSVHGAPAPDRQALESFQLVNALSPFGINGPAVAVDSVLHPLLEANTSYWLVATVSAPTQILWNDNILPFTDTVAYRDNGGPWATLGVDSAPAFAILGTPVPEPMTLGLLGMGTLGLLVYSGRRRCIRRAGLRPPPGLDSSPPRGAYASPLATWGGEVQGRGRLCCSSRAFLKSSFARAGSPFIRYARPRSL